MPSSSDGRVPASTSLADLPWDEHERLKLEWIARKFDLPPDLGGLLKLDLQVLLRRPKVGKKTIRDVQELKDRARDFGDEEAIGRTSNEPRSIEGVAEPRQERKPVGADWSMNLGRLSVSERTAVLRLERILKRTLNVVDVLALTRKDLFKLDGIGRANVLSIMSVRGRLQSALALEKQSTEDAGRLPASPLFVTGAPGALDPSELEAILAEDFDALLSSVDERSRDIALARWGYTVREETLQEVGTRHECTREYARQLEKGLDSLLRRCCRISPGGLRSLLEPHMKSRLDQVMPRLAALFARPRLFLDFLERLCDVEKGSFRKVQVFEDGDVGLRELEEYFSEHVAPVSRTELVSEVAASYGLPEPLAEGLLDRVAALGRIEDTDGQIRPLNMTKKAAVANLLVEFPNGLPWLDIARAVNARGTSGALVFESRLDAAISKNEFVYLSGRGTYRHRLFLSLPESKLVEGLGRVRATLSEMPGGKASLQALFGDQFALPYWELRCGILDRGKAFGLYFDGASGTDTISLGPIDELETVPDTIRNVLMKADTPLTMVEIATRLRTKSLGLARSNVQKAMNSGDVIRIDRMLYTTADRAFRDVNVEVIAGEIWKILDTSPMPVEADVFRERVNPALRLTYSKFFYRALARRIAQSRGWFVARTLFSKDPIRFGGLRDAFREVFRTERSSADNLCALKEVVALSRRMSDVTLSWMSTERALSRAHLETDEDDE